MSSNAPSCPVDLISPPLRRSVASCCCCCSGSVSSVTYTKRLAPAPLFPHLWCASCPASASAAASAAAYQGQKWRTLTQEHESPHRQGPVPQRGRRRSPADYRVESLPHARYPKGHCLRVHGGPVGHFHCMGTALTRVRGTPLVRLPKCNRRPELQCTLPSAVAASSSLAFQAGALASSLRALCMRLPASSSGVRWPGVRRGSKGRQ